MSYLEHFDIFSVVETWEDVNSDVISNLFPNHFSIFCAAKKVSKFGRAMGGIIVFIRKQYRQFISEIDVACGFSIFVTCKKSLFGYDKDLLLAFTYLPPHGSPFYDNQVMDEIALLEDSILKVLSKVPDIYMLLLGDFNCRTGNLADYYNFENNVSVLEEFENVFDNFCVKRISCDTIVSCSGRRLLEFCKDYSVYIVNGRVGQDKNVGSYTYIGSNGCSLIDYILASREVFESIIDFCVDSRTESPHLPVWVKLPLKNTVQTEQMLHAAEPISRTQTYSRSSRDIQMFIENVKTSFTSSFLSSVIMQIEDLSVDINEIISNIVNKIKCSAVLKTHKNILKTQPAWFDTECENLKHIKLQNLKRFRKIRSEDNLYAYVNSRNRFKNLICEKKKVYYDKQLESLISSVADPKSFWSKLKAITCKRNSTRFVNITSQEWFTHFEQLFADVNQEDSEISEIIDIENTEGEIENLIFNADIADDEILQAIKHLKKGKSGGPDGLLPEFFIESIEILLPILNKLFNRLFQSGYFPSCWSQSIIVPLHKKGDINCTDNYRGISLLDVFGKIYVSIINRRVTFYVNIYDKISEAQAGFREGYSTIDNAFVLSALLQKYIGRKGGRLYVCFVDFKKAFDSVNRQKLWQVLT
ncbi:MAG: reverse transcriptase family protein, partial [Candidatus Thiodiazotropha sp.]